LLNTHWTDLLTGLSGRWIQPSQQHGRRMPSFSSETTRFTCSSRVLCCLTDIVQQIHSLRARGVRLCQAVRAAGEARSAFLRSAGMLCTVPPASSVLAILSWYMRGYLSIKEPSNAACVIREPVILLCLHA